MMATLEQDNNQIPHHPAQLQDPQTTLTDPTSQYVQQQQQQQQPILDSSFSAVSSVKDSDHHHDTDIDEIIRRDAVELGSGERKYKQIGEQLWTDTDQQELDRLLQEGKDVYVPPDVDNMDLPVPRAKNYSYIISTTSKSSILSDEQQQQQQQNDVQPSTPKVSDRIAMWNEVISTTSTPGFIGGQIPTSVAVGNHPSITDQTNNTARDLASTSITTHQQQSNDKNHIVPIVIPSGQIINEQQLQRDQINKQQQEERIQKHHQIVHSTSTPITSTHQNNHKQLIATKSVVVVKENSRKDVDVSKTIFGGTFLTIPVISKVSQQPSDMKELMITQSDVYDQQQKEQEEQQLTVIENNDQIIQQQEQEAVHEVMIINDNDRLETSKTQVNVTEDYGLKGGHESIVNDATFVHNDKKLVTCGEDGKVCIWDMDNRNVQYEFTPYDNNESVIMVYPLQEDENEDSKNNEINELYYTLITLSKSRCLRIWLVDSHQAIMLRNSKINQSDSDLYMTITPISKSLKMKAIAAAAAAAITTSPDQPIDDPSINTGTANQQDNIDDDDDFQDIANQHVDDEDDVVEQVEEMGMEEDEEERERKRFSLSKVLSFNKSGSKKALAI